MTHSSVRISLYWKLIGFLIFVLAVPLAVLSFLSYRDLSLLEVAAQQTFAELNADMEKNTTMALRSFAESSIRKQAEDVAMQIEMYIHEHPFMTVSALQASSEFQNIAVQKVGKTGYTAVTDVDSLTCRFHKQPTITNLDLHKLADKLPGFWGVMEKTKGGTVSSGYYDWKEPDGSMRQKYMYIAIVPNKTADSVQFSVAATTYVNEFELPILEAKKTYEKKLSLMDQEITKTRRQFQLEILMVIVICGLLVVGVGYVMLNRLVLSPLKQLTTMLVSATKGDFSVRSEIHSADELETLSETMNTMTQYVQNAQSTLESRVKEQTAALEKQVHAMELQRKELEKKTKELETMNQMMVGRENTMAQMKKELEELQKTLAEKGGVV